MHPYDTYTPPPPPTPEEIRAALDIAAIFDRKRSCVWNSMNRDKIKDDPDRHHIYTASSIPEFAALGGQCHATLAELALLLTVRPCRHCGGDTVFKGGYMLACCSCLGDGCDDCAEAHQDEDGQDCGGGCDSYAENANLPDAITKWNITIGKPDAGPGLVQIVG